MKDTKNVYIDGVVFNKDNSDILEEEFFNKFIQFIESQGWQFAGITYNNSDENDNKDNDNLADFDNLDDFDDLIEEDEV